VTSRTPVLRIRGPLHTTRADTVAAEEPLEIRLSGVALAVTMRTPGDDFDLVHGFLATEGVIAGPADVAGLRYCDSVDADGRNT
jgi:FdhD protein